MRGACACAACHARDSSCSDRNAPPSAEPSRHHRADSRRDDARRPGGAPASPSGTEHADCAGRGPSPDRLSGPEGGCFRRTVSGAIVLSADNMVAPVRAARLPAGSQRRGSIVSLPAAVSAAARALPVRPPPRRDPRLPRDIPSNTEPSAAAERLTGGGGGAGAAQRDSASTGLGRRPEGTTRRRPCALSWAEAARPPERSPNPASPTPPPGGRHWR